MTEERAPTPVDAIAERWIDGSVLRHPEEAVVLGRPGGAGRYSDYSPAGADAEAEAIDRTLAELGAATPQDAVDEITVADLTRSLRLERERLDADEHLRDLNNTASPLQGIRDVFDLEPTSAPEEWADAATRLAAVGVAVDGYIESLLLGVERRVVPARRQVLLAAAEADGLAAAGSFFAGLAERGAVDVPESLAGDLRRGADSARAAYARLAEVLRSQVADAARAEDGVGREAYQLASRRFLGATVDLDETYEWGLEEVARMQAEQESVADRIVPGGSVEDAIAALDADAAHRLDGTDALREWMQGLSDRAVAALAGTHFDIPDELRRLECRIAPTTSGIIYYTPPSDDFSRPGRMWWSVPPGVMTFNTWRETTTVYHEGVPGHHLQNGAAIAARGSLNSWRRQNFVSGHGEGWALYAERLMEDLGHLDDPGDRLGMLDAQRMRAARVAIDLGVHLGKPRPRVEGLDPDGTWDAEFALAFFRRHLHMDDAVIRFEVDRYLGWPGQAPSYKVGERMWRSIRDEARTRAGSAFDLREFHRNALAIGGVGLDTLRTALVP